MQPEISCLNPPGTAYREPTNPETLFRKLTKLYDLPALWRKLEEDEAITSR